MGGCYSKRAKAERLMETNAEGHHHDLIVTIRSYTPNIRCGGPGPDSCDQDLSSMPTEDRNRLFGRRGFPGVELAIPMVFDAAGTASFQDIVLRADDKRLKLAQELTLHVR